jgi:hypothetical protein
MKNELITASLLLCCIAIISLNQPVAIAFAGDEGFLKTEKFPIDTEIGAIESQATVMREFRGIKLGMQRDQVKAVLGKPGLTEKAWEEFNIGSGDVLTLRYTDDSRVKTIQIYVTNSKQAPLWSEVVGDATIEETANGSHFARKELADEKIWVSMFQSKSGDLITITINQQL